MKHNLQQNAIKKPIKTKTYPNPNKKFHAQMNTQQVVD